MRQEYKAVDSYDEFTVHSKPSPVDTVIISVTVEVVKGLPVLYYPKPGLFYPSASNLFSVHGFKN
jgi:hypothetical protein